MRFHSSIIIPLLLFARQAQADDRNTSDDPIVYIVLHYYPNKAAAIIFGILYLTVGLITSWHVWRHRHWWGLYLPIGTLCMSLGYFLRFVMVLSYSLEDSIGMYIVQVIFILCSPAAFLAFNYTLAGRVIVRCIGREFPLIRPERFAKVFIISDLMTFNLQSAGGSLAASKNSTVSKLGNDIVLVGLVAQGASYVFFLYVVLAAQYRYTRAKPVGARHQEEWWTVIWLLYFSSVPIIIRSVYRIAEFAQGSAGYFITHEVYFYCLDGLPLFFAVACYAARWPGRYVAETSSTSILLPDQASGAESYPLSPRGD
ncbi:RTA1-domain-containing protein [Heliocybe sulcata]|uniref:RTA1-domain-containing protein n=1 Tax=Heliocybe sulcata TaxID=5364 RepID=A0A5C3N458_9AGAM|nr:RTA1-domain-containing protein [Heliocybe sulcata]